MLAVHILTPDPNSGGTNPQGQSKQLNGIYDPIWAGHTTLLGHLEHLFYRSPYLCHFGYFPKGSTDDPDLFSALAV